MLLRDASFWDFLFRVDKHLAAQAGNRVASVAGVCTARTTAQATGWIHAAAGIYDRRLSFLLRSDGSASGRPHPRCGSSVGESSWVPWWSWWPPCGTRAVAPASGSWPSYSVPTDIRSRSRCTFSREHFPQTALWKVIRGRFLRLAITDLPRVLFEAYIHHGADTQEDWRQLLEFLLPITVAGGLAIKGIS